MSLNIDYKRVSVICLLDKFTIGMEIKFIKWVTKQAKVILKGK